MPTLTEQIHALDNTTATSLLRASSRHGRLPDASRRIVGNRADFNLLPMDEALDLADDVSTSRIIVHTA
jgi:hypothetical protein